ncbi:hypothetical protein GDO86_018232 [Hymenochirus boettgeri]|uniref:Chromogranin B n=1 Tax=Hymenochirus boettgeri TaxID=247094 RepID=A0A8T2ID32_9PIPI|nr:hypothetical protein GDO86_018232 [Hymenochirus boettgeri]
MKCATTTGFSRHNLDEKEDETRNVASSESHHHITSEEEPGSHETIPGEEAEKRHHAESESEEENYDKEINHIKEKEEETGHSKERNFLDDKEERINPKESIHNEDISKKDKDQKEDLKEKKNDILEKMHQEGSEEEDEEAQKSQDVKRLYDKKYLVQPLNHHLSHLYEKSKESPESEEKRSYKPKHNILGERLLSYEKKRSYHGDQKEPMESSESTERQSFLGEQKRYAGLNSFEGPTKKNHYQVRGHHNDENSEESVEKRHFYRGSEELREPNFESHDDDDDDDDKELKKHYEEEKRYGEEKKRWPGVQNEEEAKFYQHSNEDSDESEEDIEKRHTNKLNEELFEKLRHHLQDGDNEFPYNHRRKEEDKSRYEAVDEVKRFYPGYDEDLRKRSFNENSDDFEDSSYFGNDKYKHHSKEERRPSNQYIFPHGFKWKNRYFDKDDGHIYDSEEENKRNIESKNVLPDFSDYDWWGKKQLLKGMNHQYDKRSAPKVHKFDIKRQYDRMDQLAQLLNYKKKSVEFPDFYDSDEIKKRNLNERGRQRPLTEEEEKQLENLAMMDMELQKIAEKLSHKQQD